MLMVKLSYVTHTHYMYIYRICICISCLCRFLVLFVARFFLMSGPTVQCAHGHVSHNEQCHFLPCVSIVWIFSIKLRKLMRLLDLLFV